MKPNEALDIVGCLAWHNLRPSTEEIEEATEIIDEALEKQTPMKPKKRCYSFDYWTTEYDCCPNCGVRTDGLPKYCDNCGQRIDWNE